MPKVISDEGWARILTIIEGYQDEKADEMWEYNCDDFWHFHFFEDEVEDYRKHGFDMPDSDDPDVDWDDVGDRFRDWYIETYSRVGDITFISEAVDVVEVSDGIYSVVTNDTKGA